MKKYKYAFTMIEMVFVIVILGILAAVAIPRMSATRSDAEISKGRADIASIRSSIVTERQTRLIRGDSAFINKLHSSSSLYFDGNGSSNLLMYGIAPEDANGHWHSATQTVATAGANEYTYKYKVLGADNTFTYKQSDGTFSCTQGANAPSCDLLTQ